MTEQTGNTEQEMARTERFVETASATTSPDNADSGNGAYLVTVIVLVVLVALGISLSGALGTAAGMALTDGYGISGTYDEQGEGLTLEDLEHLLDGYTGDQDTDTDGSTGSLSQSEALDLALSVYDTTVDAEVSATDYSGVPSDVRSYVRLLLAQDRDAAAEVAGYLNAAARGEDTQANVEAAVQAAADGKAAIEAIEVQSFGSDDLEEDLASARQALSDRWDAIAAEVQLLDADGDISYDELEEADEEVLSTTSEAASAFTQALGTAASE